MNVVGSCVVILTFRPLFAAPRITAFDGWAADLVAEAEALCDNRPAAGPPAHALGGIHRNVLAGTGFQSHDVMEQSQGTR